MKKILFITGHRKSGTTMFANLFDGHEDTLVYPSDLCIMYAYFPHFIGKKYSFKFKLERLIHIVKKDLSTIIKDNKLNKELNLLSLIFNFKSKINRNNIDNIEEILFNLLDSFEFSLKKKKNYKYIVIKETSMDIYFTRVFKNKKNIKFLHLIRDPRDNYASLKSGAKKYYSQFGENEKKLLASMINRARLDFSFIDINQNIFKKSNYKVIKFEDLTTKSIPIMKDICKFLKIKFSDKLLYPTILGQNTKGNSYEGEDFFKISKKNVGSWKKRITVDEAKIVEFYFEKEMKKYGYKLSKKIKKDKFLHLSSFYEWLNKEYFFHDSFKT